MKIVTLGRVQRPRCVIHVVIVPSELVESDHANRPAAVPQAAWARSYLARSAPPSNPVVGQGNRARILYLSCRPKLTLNVKPTSEVRVSTTESLLKTPLFDWHQAHGGRLVEFGGWSMPVQYTNIVAEHTAVRQCVGLFDISHMGRLTFDGPDVLDWLERVTTNHVANLADLQIQYSLLATDTGGVIDDILVYRQPYAYFVVCNASNRGPVKARLEQLRAGARGNFLDRTLDTAMIAVQGPRALETLQPLFDQSLEKVPYYHFTMGQLHGGLNAVISRTGYTGEDGFELVVGASSAVTVWEALMESGKPHGIQPCGLGARDTLRLEAAMPLYGHELSESINPYAAGVGWAVKFDKGEFAGRRA